MSRFNYLDFAAILAQVVKAYTLTYDEDTNEPLTWLRPNTFAFLKSEQELNTGNLGKNQLYQGYDYFYSRKWEQNDFSPGGLEFEYPLVAMSIDTISIPTRPQDHGKTSLNLWAVSQISDQKETDKRSWEQMSVDLHTMLANVFNEALTFSYGTLSQANNQQTTGYFSLGHIEYLKGLAATTGFLEEFAISHLVDTKELVLDYFPVAFNDNLSGVFTNIVIENGYCFDRTDLFSYKDYERNPISSSCKKC